MRVVFEGVDDGKDALATVAGYGYAILDEAGVQGWRLGWGEVLPRRQLRGNPDPWSECVTYIVVG